MAGVSNNCDDGEEVDNDVNYGRNLDYRQYQGGHPLCQVNREEHDSQLNYDLPT